ncbi:MAG: hypothetical protein LUE21_05325 [Oscillospiraceae bacterium]|nr:hypothetical protein [Oscillospiraceae bacterium]
MMEYMPALRQKAALLTASLADRKELSALPCLTEREALLLLSYGRDNSAAQTWPEAAPYRLAPDAYAMYPLFYLAGWLRAVKKTGRPVTAFRLGDGSEPERQLIGRGLLKQGPEDSWLVFSRETDGRCGERARAGDYIKLDSSGSPYPVRRDWFERNHFQGADGALYQRPVPLLFWKAGLPIREELRFLLDTGRLSLHPGDRTQYFQARLWDTDLSAASDAALLFYNLERSPCGDLTDARFNFVAGDEFDTAYTLIAAEPDASEGHGKETDQ